MPDLEGTGEAPEPLAGTTPGERPALKDGAVDAEESGTNGLDAWKDHEARGSDGVGAFAPSDPRGCAMMLVDAGAADEPRGWREAA